MKISVIIPSFNSAKYIAKAIESFVAQTYENKELVILDGISTDETHKIIADFCQKFPAQIKWIKEKDCGISNARNLALKHVTGDLVGFLGCDDILHKNLFSEIAYYTKINPDFDALYFNCYHIGFSSVFQNSTAIPFNKRNLVKHCPIASGESFYYRKNLFDSFKFNEKNRYCMDYEFNMQLASSQKSDSTKYQFFPINITAVFNQNTGINQSSANSIKQRLETVAVQLKFCANFKEKFRIFWKAKKLILKNFSTFQQIKKI